MSANLPAALSRPTPHLRNVPITKVITLAISRKTRPRPGQGLRLGSLWRRCSKSGPPAVSIFIIFGWRLNPADIIALAPAR